MDTKLERGTQIVYRPSHYSGDTFDYLTGVQPGFVTSGPDNEGAYFCRYWIVKDKKVVNELRTKAGSESTPIVNISVLETVPQEWVEQALEEWC